MNQNGVPSNMALMIKLAVAGAGITFGMEENFCPWIQRASLCLFTKIIARILPTSISTGPAAATWRQSYELS